MSKVIAAEELPDCERWELPQVGSAGSAAARARVEGPMTAAQLEALQKQAYEEGFAQGRADGLKAGEADTRTAVAQLAAVLDRLARPLEALDARVEEELVALAMSIARQMIRRELNTAPGEIVPVVREALAMLPAAAREVRVRLHPEDAALIRQALRSGEEGEQAWRVIEDPVISRGGCRVETEQSRIDATLEKRLATLTASILGGEREDDDAAE